MGQMQVYEVIGGSPGVNVDCNRIVRLERRLEQQLQIRQVALRMN